MKTNSIKITIPALLIVSTLLLGVLVPGGPIESRSFSHISPLILGVFNIFLTSLGIASLIFAYFAWRGSRWAFVAASICGVCYFLVYVLDLGQIFPLSPNQMPMALLSIEIIGCIVSLPLMYLSLTAYQMPAQGVTTQNTQLLANRLYIFIFVITLAMLGIAIIIFATRAAMGIH